MTARLQQLALFQFCRSSKHVLCRFSDEPAENGHLRIIAVKFLSLERINERAGLSDREQSCIRIIALLKKTPEQLGIA
jgi:hypothetical protein